MPEPDEWSDEDQLIQALRAPGTPAELAREQEYAAAFRAATRGRHLRLVGRAGVTGTAVAVTVALSAGVAAAAYTNTLPEPVQRLAHHVLGPVGVPAAPPRAHDARPRPHATNAPTSPSGPRRSASPSPTSRPEPSPTATPRAQRPSPTGSAPPAPVASPTAVASSPAVSQSPPGPAPTPSTPPVVLARPAHLAVSVTTAKVAPGGTVTVSGQLTTKAGGPVGDRVVKLRARTAHGAWRVVGTASTGADGTVSLPSPSLAGTTGLRLSAGKVRSHVVRVVVVPTVQASYADGAVSAVQVAVVGGRTGDRVVLLQAGRPVAVAHLAADGSASFAFAQRRRSVKVVVQLPRTAWHAQASDSLVVPARS